MIIKLQQKKKHLITPLQSSWFQFGEAPQGYWGWNLLDMIKKEIKK